MQTEDAHEHHPNTVGQLPVIGLPSNLAVTEQPIPNVHITSAQRTLTRYSGNPPPRYFPKGVREILSRNAMDKVRNRAGQQSPAGDRQAPEGYGRIASCGIGPCFGLAPSTLSAKGVMPRGFPPRRHRGAACGGLALTAAVASSIVAAKPMSRYSQEFIRAIPKTDLHVHLDGSLRLADPGGAGEGAQGQAALPPPKRG